jgi:hypothetical protein
LRFVAGRQRFSTSTSTSTIPFSISQRTDSQTASIEP